MPPELAGDAAAVAALQYGHPVRVLAGALPQPAAQHLVGEPGVHVLGPAALLRRRGQDGAHGSRRIRRDQREVPERVGAQLRRGGLQAAHEQVVRQRDVVGARVREHGRPQTGVAVAEDLRPEWQAFLNAVLKPATV